MYYLSRDVGKPDFCKCENKDADQLRGNREADQRLCFHFTDSSISVPPKFKNFKLPYNYSSSILWLYSPVCVGPGRKSRRPFSDVAAHFMLDFDT